MYFRILGLKIHRGFNYVNLNSQRIYKDIKFSLNISASTVCSYISSWGKDSSFKNSWWFDNMSLMCFAFYR